MGIRHIVKKAVIDCPICYSDNGFNFTENEFAIDCMIAVLDL